MSKSDTGGHAFPFDEEFDKDGHSIPKAGKRRSQPGMSLLDHFAEGAMRGQLSSAETVAALADELRSNEKPEDLIAKISYDYAAAMVAEKRRRESDG